MHPPADVRIDEALIRRLLAQFPQYAELDLRYAAYGWDNEMWRLGEDLAVRLPRREMGASLLRNEVRWLPRIAAGLPLPVPAALQVGHPTADYPYPWAVVPWLRGVPATTRAPAQRDRYAAELAQFFAAMHEPAPSDAPRNRVRGVPLADRDDAFRARASRLADRSVLIAAWDAGLRATAYDDAAVWLHGDPHPFNCLVDSDGALSAVVDFGDLTAGDPASDLACAWAHFTAAGRAEFRAILAIDQDTWIRSKAWAASYAASYLSLGADDPLRVVAEHVVAELLSNQ